MTHSGRVSPKVVATVLARDGYACVICGYCVYARQRGVDWSIHHRRPAGMGGSKAYDTHRPPNLLTVCGHGTAGCHGRIERDRAEARHNGWLVPSYGHPPAQPVLIRQERWVYLTDDGRYVDAPPPREATA